MARPVPWFGAPFALYWLGMTRATLTATLWREDDTYVSLCPELGVASCGDSPDDALKMLKEAVELFLQNARQLGIWEDVRAAIESPQRFTAPLDITLP
jgi:predicted RNase H-like HicB family nuclease